MQKISSEEQTPRIPPEVGGIQVNFCKNPTCPNFGVPAAPRSQRGRSSGRDVYTKVASGRDIPVLHCHACGEYPPLKSNLGIHAEKTRLAVYLEPSAEPSCSHEACTNHRVPLSAGKSHYQSFGKTSSGSQRYRCKKCKKTFTVGKATVRHKQPHKNKLVFQLLMNKTPFRRTCEVAGLSTGSLYPKIDFIHRQCLAFAAHRERKLLEGQSVRRLYVGVDRQTYVVNWMRREDKRNIQLSAVGSADNATGYVFGMHLNFDPALGWVEIEQDARERGDYEKAHPFRRYAHLWLEGDYQRAAGSLNRLTYRNDTLLKGAVATRYMEAEQREDVEQFEALDADLQLPSSGMQTHAEYTLYAHFFLLRSLFGGVEKVRFFLDQDSGMRAACLGAFQREIQARTCDAFYVRVMKEVTVDEKRRALSKSRAEWREASRRCPDLDETQLKLALIKERMGQMVSVGKWKDRWLVHPFPNMSEPEKAICYLTDYGDCEEDHLAWLYNKASLHAIDRFFMQVRRRLSLLERPIASANSARRMWHGYSAYNPESIVKLLDIFRVFYNYVLVGKNKKTPAMHLGLARGANTVEDIIYHS